MKKIFFIVSMSIVVLSGCKKASTNSCQTPLFTASPLGGGVVNISQSYNGYGFINVEYGANGYTRGSGTKSTIQTSGGQISGLANGAYDFYVQGNCGGTSNSDWAGPLSVLVTGGTTVGNCYAPDNLTANVGSTDIHLAWYKPNITGSALYELRYDTTGFPLTGGHFELVNTESAYITSVRSNTTYDFVVRAKCDDGNWGPWSIRKSFYVTSISSNCQGPSYVNASNQGGSAENFAWDMNGVSTVEYGFGTGSNQPPTNPYSSTYTNITYTNLVHGTTYYFFVRGICSGNTRTAWVSTSLTY
jgi:hypothetical protein